MEKLDIVKNNLFINHFEYVMRSVLHKSKNKNKINGRLMDGFVYITEGSCTYVFDDGYTFTANEGDIFYLANNSVYTMDVHTENYYAIFTNFKFSCENERKSEIYTPQDKTYAKTLFSKLYRTYISDSESFTKCISIIYEIYSLIKAVQNDKEKTVPAYEFAERIKNQIDENYNSPTLSISSLADEAKISEVYLRKLFKNQYGISPSRYIISVRIKAAVNLMPNSSISLNDCALQSGFSSLQYFCRVFKKQMGVSPAQYKKERFF